jgi:hypothetical protein
MGGNDSSVAQNHFPASQNGYLVRKNDSSASQNGFSVCKKGYSVPKLGPVVR